MVAFEKLLPMMVNTVEVLANSTEGEIDDTVGSGTYVNMSAGDVTLVPPGVTTLTSTGTPGAPVGAVAVI